MKSKVGCSHSKPIPGKRRKNEAKQPYTAHSIDQSSENEGETVRDDQAIPVILHPTLKVAICIAVVSN